MCGIFGYVSDVSIRKHELETMVTHARQRGRDSSGIISFQNSEYKVRRADYDINKLVRKYNDLSSVLFGHSRLITNGLSDNQPVVRNEIILVHNGIVVNDEELWEETGLKRYQQIDSEIIAALAEKYIEDNQTVDGLSEHVLSKCKGVVACALAIPSMGKLLLFSNNGSLYVGYKNDGTLAFSSESYPLTELDLKDVEQLIDDNSKVIDIPKAGIAFSSNDSSRVENLIPPFQFNKEEESLLKFEKVDIKRCTKCILPETMPFIHFDSEGVCNYCRSYKLRNVPKPKEELFTLVEPYRRNGELDCIVPFSGGRDSCYGLHLIVNELGMKPVTYTYDWGMVTDLGRRNISRMCAQLGVENIIVAADISQKRKNIAMNLKAWLKKPHLGMISIFTAGDKHFFRHVATVKKQTGINLNLWGVNPLEVTHFKSGFLGVKPDFEEEKVYSHGIMKQLRYHYLRTKAMLQSPGYFNSSLWDTLSGEYYRSFTEKKDYYHIFDYWTWDEEKIDDTLLNQYDWETAIDTSTTWRIGDGTAAFYNYIYYTVAGFTEHDTFRSNQIREGQITRDEALKLCEDENQPRYQNIKWYLDALNADFRDVIKVVNSIPKLY